ncbi:VOC family protein [Nonomuraea endophytica]|uniref:Putative glyoxalase superfamily protein PhnB n=1 Tax=Nonomuraea endophytica TaxID=714136 RepID=A0A7W8ECJ7_9ACTN|nr:VOC family protein [Nonomuraea endophytica]MBB5074604.1 putative glyoxalase superfamily protein PhnB [Nonomuraea endophytica]
MTTLRPRGLSPHLFVLDTEGAIAFYKAAFGAVEVFRNTLPNGVILFVELQVGDGRLLVSEETPELGALAPPTVGGSPVLILLEIDDPVEVERRALDAGAVSEMPVQEAFWGEKYGVIRDPFGHRWAVTTAREQLTPDDILDQTPENPV